jgi:hypothetical protein
MTSLKGSVQHTAAATVFPEVTLKRTRDGRLSYSRTKAVFFEHVHMRPPCHAVRHRSAGPKATHAAA